MFVVLWTKFATYSFKGATLTNHIFWCCFERVVMTNLGFSCCCFFLPPPLGRRRILMKGSLVVTVWHRCFFLSSTSQGYFKILNSYMFLLVIITKMLFCWEKINKRGSLMKRSFTVNVKHLNIRFSETILFFLVCEARDYPSYVTGFGFIWDQNLSLRRWQDFKRKSSGTCKSIVFINMSKQG